MVLVVLLIKERPNRCFMNGCNRTFNSTEALQKHLNRHFRETSPTGKKKPSKESSIKAQLGAASSAMKPHQSSLIMRTLNPSSAVRSAGSRDDGQDVAEEMGDEGASGRVLQAGLSRGEVVCCCLLLLLLWWWWWWCGV